MVFIAPNHSSGLDHVVFKGIERKGFRQPTPIQRKAIPPIIDGRDVVAMSRTGSGKTAAFVIPILQKLKHRDMKGIRALIVSPTRELAVQTFSFVKELGKFTGLKCALLVGGDRIEEQFQTVHEKPDILIATPGRLLHVIVEMDLRLGTVQTVVFDEADRLFEMGFSEQLHEVLNRLPENRQTLLFSATLPKMIVDFTKAGLTDPLLVRLDVDEKISENLSMVFLLCRKDDKAAAFLHLVRNTIAEKQQTIVFCATMKHVEYLHAVATNAGIDCVVLYSQLDSSARNINIQRFRRKECFLLIVTDIAARGVDIPLLDVAVNYHFPPKPKLFVHRVGRVARAGRTGRAITLLTNDELSYLADLFLFLGRPIEFAAASSEHQENVTLVGTLPENILDNEIDHLRALHENSDEIVDLSKKAENAMQKYIRTRPQPSAESVRRAKDELRSFSLNAAVHPSFKIKTRHEEERQVFLRDLHNFKPNVTVFEMQSSSKTLPAMIMKEKRRAHQKYIKFTETIKIIEPNHISHAIEDSLECKNVDESFNEVIRNSKFISADKLMAKKMKSRKRKADEFLREKNEHFIAYAPAEADTERGLAVDRNFNNLAKSSEIEILADNAVDLHKQNKRKIWDRKLKKFIGDANEGVKKIRTEEGTILPATYKSGRYEAWQKKQQILYQRNEADDEDNKEVNEKSSSQRRGNRKQFRDTKKRNYRSELKSSEQILKVRRRKEKIKSYQTYRKQQNLKKKTGSKSGSQRRK